MSISNHIDSDIRAVELVKIDVKGRFRYIISYDSIEKNDSIGHHFYSTLNKVDMCEYIDKNNIPLGIKHVEIFSELVSEDEEQNI